MVKYSIFIPAFNAFNFIENFCENIKKQNLKPHQVIIVDDTKNTENFKSEVEKKLNFLNISKNLIILKNKKNLKPPRCWNHCLNLFNTKLVFRMDVDDVWSKDHAEKMLEVYKNNKEYALYLQEFKSSPMKKIFYNNNFLFTNQGLHSSCLFNLNVIYPKYPIIDLPLDDLYIFIKINYFQRKKIKFVKFSTCYINTSHDKRWSNNTNKERKMAMEKKLFYLALKKYLNLKKLNFSIFVRIFYKLNIFKSIYVIYKIISYTKK